MKIISKPLTHRQKFFIFTQTERSDELKVRMLRLSNMVSRRLHWLTHKMEKRHDI